MKASGSGKGCRPFLPVFGAERSRSRLANTAPGMWASRYWLSPQSGLARSCRQSNSRQGMAAVVARFRAREIAIQMREQRSGDVPLAVLLLAEVRIAQVVAAVENPPLGVRCEILGRDQCVQDLFPSSSRRSHS